MGLCMKLVHDLLVGFCSSSSQGCELELELKELGYFGRIQTRTRKLKISELELELELKKSLCSWSSFNE